MPLTRDLPETGSGLFELRWPIVAILVDVESDSKDQLLQSI